MVAASFLSLSFTLVLPPPPLPAPRTGQLHSALPHQEVSESETSAGSDRKEGWSGSETGWGDYRVFRDGGMPQRRRETETLATAARTGNQGVLIQRVKTQCSANSPLKRPSEIKPSANQRARLALKRASMPLKSKLSRKAIHRDASGTASVAASASTGLRYASRANYNRT